MQRKIFLSMNKWLWNPYFVGMVIVATIIVAKLPFWNPHRPYFPISPAHFTIWVQGAALIAFAFLVGYSLVKPFNTLAFWKFAIYLIVLSEVNWFIDMQPRWDFDWLINLVSSYHWFFCRPLPFFVSSLLNMGFLKYLFQMDTRSAIRLGVLLGMIDAYMMEASMPVY